MLKTLLIASLAVSASAGVNEVRMESAPVKFQTVLDPVSARCVNPQLDPRSGIYMLDDGRFGVLVIFTCEGGEQVETKQ